LEFGSNEIEERNLQQEKQESPMASIEEGIWRDVILWSRNAAFSICEMCELRSTASNVSICEEQKVVSEMRAIVDGIQTRQPL
jgi:hypothetical protein